MGTDSLQQKNEELWESPKKDSHQVTLAFTTMIVFTLLLNCGIFEP